MRNRFIVNRVPPVLMHGVWVTCEWEGFWLCAREFVCSLG